MSDSLADTFQYLDDYQGSTLSELFLDGTYTVLLFVLLYSAARRKNQLLLTTKILISISALQYIMELARVAIRWNFQRYALVRPGASPDNISDYLSTPPLWNQVVTNIFMVVNIAIADLILIWRCWIVWGRKWKVIIFPIITTIAEAGLLVFYTYDDSLFIFPSDQFKYSIDTASFSLTLFTTLSTTILIVIRICMVGRADGMRRYLSTIEVIVESAMLYSASLLFYIITLNTGGPWGYGLAIIPPMSCIAPALIVIWVSLGLARANDHWTKHSEIEVSDLRFNVHQDTTNNGAKNATVALEVNPHSEVYGNERV